ncbi:MAG: hypothetical protein GY765_02335 [bacterium]|nr:hypothetical protein [bacterium]
MTKRILIFIVCIVLLGGLGFSSDYDQLMDKTIKLNFKFTKLMSYVGVVVRVDDNESEIRLKRTKAEWVNAFRDIPPKSKGFGRIGIMPYRGIKEIYILEEGKEPLLWDPADFKRKEAAAKEAAFFEKINPLKTRYFVLDKILVSPTRKKHKPQEGKLSFEDELISVSWVPLEVEFQFVIKNKSEFDKLTISWDDSSFVDQNSKAGRIMHSGVRIIDRTKSIPPTILPPETKFDGFLVPVDKVFYDKYFSKWDRKPMYKFKPRPDEAENPETLRYILSISTPKEKFDYSFHFKSAVSPFGKLPAPIMKGLLETSPKKFMLSELSE